MSQTTKKDLPVMVRKAINEDVPFIFSSWLKSFRDSFFAKNVSNTVYYSEHHKLIENLLLTCETFVVCDSQNPDQIYGYAVAEKIDGIDVIHFVYIKHTYRMLGLAKKLMEQFNIDFSKACIYTHHTKVADKLMEKLNLVHSPYVAFMKYYREKSENNGKGS